MNSFSQVESALKEVLEVIKPLRDDWVTRSKVIDEVREVVQSMESFRGATVEPFGSFVSNLFSRWGDLDISIELPYSFYVSSSGKKRKQSLLAELLKALRQKGGWQRLQFIPNARVPILKIVSKWQNISCDISIDNQCQIKSKFLVWLSEIDDRFRDMVLLVKEWAKANGINNPKTGTFNSYSLSLLVIFHFQTCAPPILPPLKDIYPANVVDDLAGVRADAESRIAQVSSSNIARFRSRRAPNRSSLSELFVSFIAKFSDINSKAKDMGICPFTGQWEYITSNTRWLPRTFAIFIEDPFEQPENSARSVGQKQLVKISEAFEATRRMLISANLTHSSLLPTLVGPQAAKYMVKHSGGYSSYNGGQYLNTHPHSQPQSHQAVHTPYQMQQHHQYRNTRPSSSQMQHQAQRMMPSTSKVQSPVQKTGVEIRTRSQPQHQFQKPTQAPSSFQKVQPNRIRVQTEQPITIRGQPQLQRPRPSFAQVQPQPQRRMESYPVAFSSQRPFQMHQNQGQMWRPKSEK